MPRSSHKTKCAEAQTAYSSSVSPSSGPVPQAASGGCSSPVHKKPIKLDIAAILAGDSGTPSDSPDPPLAAADSSVSVIRNSAGQNAASSIPEAVHSSDSDTPGSGVSAQPVTLAVILLIILCVILGLAILAFILVIVWPNIIPILFYHSTI